MTVRATIAATTVLALAATLTTPNVAAAQALIGPPAPGQVPHCRQGGTFEKPGSWETRATSASATHPVPRLIESPLPQFPVENTDIREAGLVTMCVVIDGKGRVRETRRMTMPDLRLANTGEQPLLGAPFTRSADNALRKWRYDVPGIEALSFVVQFSFAPGRAAEVVATWIERPTLSPPFGSMRLAASPTTQVMPGGTIQPPRKIKDRKPEMPGRPRSGTVFVEAVIGTDGRITRARAISDDLELEQAATTSVKGWEFTPLVVNGVPTAVIMLVTVSFSVN